ncbi:hypothetical protein KI387_033366, partial [Taxus chinensis]
MINSWTNGTVTRGEKEKGSRLLVFDHRYSTSVKLVHENKRLNFYYGGKPGRRVDY